MNKTRKHLYFDETFEDFKYVKGWQIFKEEDMKKSKIAFVLVIASFLVWVLQIYNSVNDFKWSEVIGPTIQFVLMIGFYFAVKYEK